jgi:hypothetical protein
MDGLDKLVQAEQQSSAPIDSFVAASNFETDLSAARAVRETTGAHLEIDDTCSLASLLASLDAYDLDKALGFYQRVAAAFNKLCFTILFLRMYAADGRRMYGVSMNRSAATPFVGVATPQPTAPPEPPPINDEEAYRKNLTRWLDGDDDQKGDARQFFWHAFAGSDVVETIQETETFGAGQHYRSHDFRKAHQFLLSALSDGISDFDFKGILDLILSCRGGWPYGLAEILVRHGRNTSIFRRYLICHVLGEIGSAPHASVSAFLEDSGRSTTWAIRLEAALARFKTFVKSEGLYRTNHKGQTTADFNAFVNALLTPMSPDERLICKLGFASILGGPKGGPFLKPFESNYAALQTEIETLCLPLLEDDANKTKAAVLKKLIQTDDFVGVCVLVALDLDGGDKHPLFAALVDNCCNGTIAAANHDQAARHLAMCFILKKAHHFALEVAKPLATRNPDWIDVQILVAEILGQTVGAEREAAERVDGIRSAYKLTAAFEARLAAVETEIAPRIGSS